MAQTVIQIENLSKLYRLGEIGTGTLSHDLNRWWARARGKEDPSSLIGQANDRTREDNSHYSWALQNINLDIKQGEVLGIIGKNGAGKSTLLKLISRITSPTSGTIKIKGRIASLLEVGTGMHPEMTARENIYLNGAILGMKRLEIRRKFDDIIDFAGCRMYVDTPIKRFSSGMQVRLGFAVAAFLEPEILIVDEVLAVGDAEFQKKAIGKMKEISAGYGRTVLFVSHNMDAIDKLCTRSLLLESGGVKKDGLTPDVIKEYLFGNHHSEKIKTTECFRDTEIGDGNVRILETRLLNSANESSGLFKISDSFQMEIIYEILQETMDFHFYISVFASSGTLIFSSADWDQAGELGNTINQKGLHKTTIEIPGHFLNAGKYTISLQGLYPKSHTVFSLHNVLIFNIERRGGSGGIHSLQRKGICRPILTYNTEQRYSR